LIDSNKHLILETSHPSPLWSYRGFLWSNCFLECNSFLKEKWFWEIKW
jgi:uracil-DNA glycosylase